MYIEAGSDEIKCANKSRRHVFTLHLTATIQHTELQEISCMISGWCSFTKTRFSYLAVVTTKMIVCLECKALITDR